MLNPVELEVQRRAEDDRVLSLEHLQRPHKLLLQIRVPNCFRRRRHLSDKLLQPTEDADDSALELVSEL